MFGKGNREKIYKLVGKIGDEYYGVDSLFEHAPDSEGKVLKGAVGTVLVAITEEEYKFRTSQDQLEERFEDYWRQIVANGDTELSLSEWTKYAFENDGDESVFDIAWDYGQEVIDFLVAQGEFEKDEVKFFEAVGGGRCFNQERVNAFDTIYDADLLRRIAKQEGFDASIEVTIANTVTV
jgi:hypothetical protein